MSNYWIYTLTKDNYDSFLQYKGDDINFSHKNDIVTDDIIMLFLKNNLQNGFVGILKAASNATPSKITIFKNNNLNKFVVKLKTKNIFDMIKVKDILIFLNYNEVGFKTPATFGSKFTKIHNNICDISIYGKEIVEYLLSKNQSINLASIVKSTLTSIKNMQKYDTKLKLNSLFKNDITNYLIEDSEDNLSNSKSFENSESDSESYNYNSNSKSNSESSSEESEDELEDDPNGYIPIMIVPCDDFKIPNLNEDMYIVNHYKTCKKCDVTNNNDKELCSILNHANIEFIEITDEKHAYFDPALEAYYKLKKFEPMGAENHPFVRLVYINNDHDIYNNCLLVTWCDL